MDGVNSPATDDMSDGMGRQLQSVCRLTSTMKCILEGQIYLCLSIHNECIACSMMTKSNKPMHLQKASIALRPATPTPRRVAVVPAQRESLINLLHGAEPCPYPLWHRCSWTHSDSYRRLDTHLDVSTRKAQRPAPPHTFHKRGYPCLHSLSPHAYFPPPTGAGRDVS
jgi:hypothetical protein